MTKFLSIVAENVAPSLGVNRENLPQVKDLDKFKGFLKKLGVSFKEREMPSFLLVGIQNDLDPEKITNLKKSRDYKQILISSDLRVIDGHHRWAAAYENGDSIMTLEIGASIDEILGYMEEFNQLKESKMLLEYSDSYWVDGNTIIDLGTTYHTEFCIEHGYANDENDADDAVDRLVKNGWIKVHEDGGYYSYITIKNRTDKRIRKYLLNFLTSTYSYEMDKHLNFELYDVGGNLIAQGTGLVEFLAQDYFS